MAEKRMTTNLSDRVRWLLAEKNLSQSRLAKIAGVKQPSVFGWICGKTQTINFYNINDALYYVDLPGYGYAKVSVEVKAKWGKMIERYLQKSPMLRCVFLLIDIRHEPSENDKLMYDWVVSNGYHPVIIATKLSQIQKHVKMVREGLGIPKEGIVIPFSAETKQGRDEIWALIESMMNPQVESEATENIESADAEGKTEGEGKAE